MSVDPPCRVVINARAQLALWPLGRPPPTGWYPTAMAGSRSRCCRYVDGLAGPAATTGLAAAYAPPPPPPESSAALLERLDHRPAAAPAVRDAHSRLAFGELSRRTAAVRADLAGAGITAGEAVVIARPLGVDLVVALLGVLAAGGTAVPAGPGAGEPPVTEGSLLIADGPPRRLRPAPADRSRAAALVLDSPPPEAPAPGPFRVVWEHRQVAALADLGEAVAGGPFERLVLVGDPEAAPGPVVVAGLLWALGHGAEAVLAGAGPDRRVGTLTLAGAGAGAPDRYRARLRRGDGPATTLTGFSAGVGPALTDGPGAGSARPLPGVRPLVLDHDLLPTAPGVPGRLHLAGWPVGGGYLGRPGPTARVLRPDPTGPPGSRMLDTGRTVRLGPDGVIDGC
jgi:non-ribosomal peptide synthetase component F